MHFSMETDIHLQVESPILVAVSLENETPEPLALSEPRHAFPGSGGRLANEVQNPKKNIVKLAKK